MSMFLCLSRLCSHVHSRSFVPLLKGLLRFCLHMRLEDTSPRGSLGLKPKALLVFFTSSTAGAASGTSGTSGATFDLRRSGSASLSGLEPSNKTLASGRAATRS